MTRNELQTILIDRVKIIQNPELSAEERQAENEITQTIVRVAQFMFAKLNTDGSDTCFVPAAENENTDNKDIEAVPAAESQNIENKTSYEQPKSNRTLSFTEEHENWLINNFGNYTNMLEMTDAFNKYFSVLVNRQLITEKCKLYGLMNHRSVKYTLKEDSWLKRYAETMSYETLADLFEIHFHRKVTPKALRAHCRNLGVADREYCRMTRTKKKQSEPQTPVDVSKIYSGNGKNGIVIQNSINYITQNA